MTHLTHLQLDTLWSRLIMTRYVQMLWTLSIISLWPCDLFKLPVDFINMQLGHMVTHLDNGQHLHLSYMYTVIWLVNNDLSEVSVQIHSVTGIIESEPSENSYNRNVWEKIKTLGFWFSYQNTPYETLISPNLNCDLVTSLVFKSQFKLCCFQICCTVI